MVPCRGLLPGCPVGSCASRLPVLGEQSPVAALYCAAEQQCVRDAAPPGRLCHMLLLRIHRIDAFKSNTGRTLGPLTLLEHGCQTLANSAILFAFREAMQSHH